MARPGSPADWQALGCAGIHCGQLDPARAGAALAREVLVVRLHEAGASDEELAKAAGVSPRRIAAILLDASSPAGRARRQRYEALERARQIRDARAEIRQQLARGELEIAELLQHPPAALSTMRLEDLLMSQRGWGRARTRRFLSSLGVPSDELVYRLSAEVRGAIATRLAAPTNL